jgi:hypothetical protein
MATSSNTPKGYATRAPCRNPPLKADSVILQQTLRAANVDLHRGDQEKPLDLTTHRLRMVNFRRARAADS